MNALSQHPEATDESIRGAPATEPLVPVVAPLALDPHGRVTTGDPLIFGTFSREAALGLFGLTAPGIGDCVALDVPGRAPVVVPGRCWVLAGAPGCALMFPGLGVDGATPGGADPGELDGAVADPVLPPVPLAPPDDPAPPDEPDCACAGKPSAAMTPAAKASFLAVKDIAFSRHGFL